MSTYKKLVRGRRILFTLPLWGVPLLLLPERFITFGVITMWLTGFFLGAVWARSRCPKCRELVLKRRDGVYDGLRLPTRSPHCDGDLQSM